MAEEQQCVACAIDACVIGESEIDSHIRELVGWDVVEKQGVKRLSKRYKFSDFAKALRFVNFVGELADAKGHHPEITFSWGYVIVEWWSHKAKGIHTYDVVMARDTDGIFAK